MSTARKTLPSIAPPSYQQVAMGAWLAAVALYCVGDTGTTIVSMELGGFEASPIPLWFYQTLGYVGLVLNKLLVVGLCWVAWRLYPSIGDIGPDPYRLAIPLLMVGRGAWLVLNNVSVIAALV